jgi:hypothetical protein
MFIKYNLSDIAAVSLSTRRALVVTLVASLSLVTVGVAFRGGTSGLGAGAELVQGLAQLLFIAAFAMSSVAPRISRASADEIALQTRTLTYAFGGSYAMLLAIVGLQWLVLLNATSLSALLYVSVNALILAVLIWMTRTRRWASPHNRIPRTFHVLGLSYFWCSFILLDYARVGRSRLTDPFFVTAIALLVVVLALRVTVLWTARMRLAEKVG